MIQIGNIVKQSRFIYNIYFYIGNIAVRFLKIFLKPDSKLIVFNSFGGRKYDDSPKSIYLKMIEDARFIDYKFVWAFVNPDEFSIPKGDKVKVDTFSYFKTVLKARVWITNTTMTRALSFKGINTFSLNTWHGSAIKKIGKDAEHGSAFVSNGNSYTNVYLAQGEYDRRIFSKAFCVNQKNIELVGLPRNDELVEDEKQVMLNNLRKKLAIPQGKKVILYAPTFREYDKSGANIALNLPVNWDKWERRLSDKYCLLIRAHHAVVKAMDIKENGFIINVSAYPHLNDLMILSDILISDYSSIFFDYAIQGKPMFCFSYDFDRYEKERGLYFDIREELDNKDINTEDKLLSAILNMDVDERIETSIRFRDKYVQKFGTATLETINLVYNAIK